MTFLTRLSGRWVPELRKYVFTQSVPLEYEGPVAYAFGGGGGGGGEVVPTGPWGPQVPFISQLFGEANNLYQQGPPQYPSFSTVAGMNPQLQQSQQGIQNFVNNNAGLNQGAINTAANAATTANPVSAAAQPLTNPMQQGIMQLLQSNNNALTGFGQQTAPGAIGAINQATAGAGQPGQLNTSGAPQLSGSGINIAPTLQQNLSGRGLNPFIEDTAQAATRSLTNNFQRNILPSIGDQASSAGQFGGTRHGVAQGIAAGDLQQNVADVNAQLFAHGFDANTQAQQQALGQIGQTQAQQAGLGLQGAGISEQIRNNMMQQALQGAGLSQQGLQGGLGLGQQGVATGTAQAGNLLQAGNAQGMQQLFGALGMIPGLQGNQLAQLGALNQSGLQQQGFNQAQLDDQVNRYFFNQNAPYNALTQFQNFVGGSFGSSLPQNGQYPGFTAQAGPAQAPAPQPNAQPYPWYPPNIMNPFAAYR